MCSGLKYILVNCEMLHIYRFGCRLGYYRLLLMLLPVPKSTDVGRAIKNAMSKHVHRTRLLCLDLYFWQQQSSCAVRKSRQSFSAIPTNHIPCLWNFPEDLTCPQFQYVILYLIVVNSSSDIISLHFSGM